MSEQEKRIEALETQAYFFHTFIERSEHLYLIIQTHETQLAKLEEAVKRLQDAASQGTP